MRYNLNFMGRNGGFIELLSRPIFSDGSERWIIRSIKELRLLHASTVTGRLNNDGQSPYFDVGSYEAGTYGLRIMTMSGRMLYAAMLHLDIGTNHIALPAGLPTRELLIGAVGNAAPVKFHLAD